MGFIEFVILNMSFLLYLRDFCTHLCTHVQMTLDLISNMYILPLSSFECSRSCRHEITVNETHFLRHHVSRSPVKQLELYYFCLSLQPVLS